MIEAHRLQTTLSQLKTRLTADYPVVRLVLFGSAVRGTMDEESDVDVLVVIPLVRGQRNVRLAAAIRDRVRASFPMDVIVRSPRDISRGLARGDKFITGIFRDGRVVYEGEHP